MAHQSTLILSNGVEATLEQPDLYSLLAQVGRIPNPAVASVLRLLEGAGAIDTQNELQRLQGLREYFQGLYALAALTLVSPALRLEGKPQEGEIGPRDLSQGDLWAIYNFCNALPRTPARPVGGEPGRGEDPAGAPAPVPPVEGI
jgi:hypothetical protein